MASWRDPEELSLDPEQSDEIDEDSPRSRRTSRRPRAHRAGSRSGVRRWRPSEEPDEEDSDDELDPAPGHRRFLDRESHPVYWRARDSLYFEPLVAVAIIVVLLVGLYAYTQNWPPVYVVESDSMQHGTSDVLGVINTGDLVLAQRASVGQITPYVVGISSGYSTYGEYGDVILYSANGQRATPIIHRALLYLEWDPLTGAYNATELSGLKCGSDAGAVYNTTGTPGDCGWTNLTGTLTLYHVGWQGVTVTVDLSSSLLGRHSGFLTMGDNNLVPTGCTSNCVGGLPDQVDGLSQLVEPGWVVGVARGMLPWFGAVKLVLEGNAGSVPPQSWQFLGLTVVGLILLAFGIHYAFRAEGIEDERRKEEEAEARAAATESGSPEDGRGRRFLRALRPWGRSEEPDEEDEARPRPRVRPRRTASPSPGRRRGRPSPKVRRAERAKHHKSRDDDDL